MKRTTKKDFEKKTHKVGQRKFRSNETKANSVSSRRVVMPSQNIEGSSDVIAEALIGLRHYNEKKRLDAINSLFRHGCQNITDDYLGEVIVGVGYCLCDDDELVRGKCGSFLDQILTELDPVSLGPFYQKTCVQIHAGLGHVKAAIRSDTVQFLNRIIYLNIFEEDEINQFIRTLIDLDSTFITNQSTVRNTPGKKKHAAISEDVRLVLWDCVESLLSLLVEKNRMLKEGDIHESQWTISNVLNRVFRPTPTISGNIEKFLQILNRHGEDEVRDRVEALAIELGFVSNGIHTADISRETVKPVSKKTKNSVFSKLSMLMSDSD